MSIWLYRLLYIAIICQEKTRALTYLPDFTKVYLLLLTFNNQHGCSKKKNPIQIVVSS